MLMIIECLNLTKFSQGNILFAVFINQRCKYFAYIHYNFNYSAICSIFYAQ